MAWEKSPTRVTERALALMLDKGVMKEHLTAQLSDFSGGTQRTARALLQSTQAHGLRASGTPGTGKTRLAVALCREMLMAGKKVEYTMSRAFFRRLWSTYRDDAAESEEQVIQKLATVDFLVLDDLGHEGKVSDAVVGALHEVLSERHGNYRPTVVTTNLGIEEIASKYDASIASRLEAWYAVVLTGADRRAG